MSACLPPPRAEVELRDCSGGQGMGGLVSRQRPSHQAGRRPGPVAAQAGFAGVQDCFEQEGQLLQGDVHQLP
jgi:hypothetical protein